MWSLLDFLFPKKCLGCEKIGDYICPRCLPTITQKNLVCYICREESFGGLTHPILCKKYYSLDGIWFLGAYEGVLKKAIQIIKYQFVSKLMLELADIIIIYLNLKQPYFLEKINKSKWMVVPVPLHKYRENQRGFNQSALLAKILAQKLNLEYSELLIRNRFTKPQVGLSSKQRQQNIKNAFEISSNYELKTMNSVLLIDDVWTTGSTLKECCKALKIAGVGKVWALTIAH